MRRHNGPSPGVVTGMSDQARAFARGQQQVMLAGLLSSPLKRPAGWAILLGALPTAVIVWPTAAAVMAPAAAAAGAYIFALAVVFGAWVLVGQVVERRAFRRAPYRWLIRCGPSGAAGAYARLDRRRRLTVYSVWAAPQGHGHGSKLLEQIIRDTADTDLWLVADNRRAAELYRRHGFAPVRRELLGQRMVLRRQGPGIHAEGSV